MENFITFHVILRKKFIVTLRKKCGTSNYDSMTVPTLKSQFVLGSTARAELEQIRKFKLWRIWEIFIVAIMKSCFNLTFISLTEKARNFREFFGRNRPHPKVRLEYDFLGFLIFEDIQNLKKTIKSLKNQCDSAIYSCIWSFL